MLTTYVSAEISPAPIRVILDGEALTFDVAPTIVGGRVMVPMRGIFEVLGATVEWDYDTRTITATKDELVIVTAIGEPNMQIGAQVIAMDIAPMLIWGRTMVPVRFVTEAFGVNVLWDEVKRTVHIDTAQVDEDTEPTPARERIGRLMVMYHANGGIGAPISNTVTINEDGSVRFRLSRSEPRKEGYTFIGWLFENDYMNFYINEPGDHVLVLDLDPTQNEFITYFAQWERNE